LNILTNPTPEFLREGLSIGSRRVYHSKFMFWGGEPKFLNRSESYCSNFGDRKSIRKELFVSEIKL